MAQRLSMMIKRGMFLALMFIALLPSVLTAKGVGDAVIMQDPLLQYSEPGFLTITDTLQILFPVNAGYVDETYGGNARSIKRIQEWTKVYCEGNWNLEEVLVVGSCSPV